MNILHFPTKFQSSKLPITILGSFLVSVLTLIPPQRAPLPPPSFTPDSIAVIFSTTTYLCLRLPARNWFRTLSPVQLLKLLNPVTSLLSCALALAQNNRTHRIQTPLTHLQSPHNHPISISPPPHLWPTSSQISLCISGNPRSTTSIILATYNWSLLSVCLTLFLESTSYFSPSTSFQSFPLCPACSCSCRIFSLCQLTTLTIHDSLSLSLPTQDLHLFHKSSPP